jgi:hypothetical protein
MHAPLNTTPAFPSQGLLRPAAFSESVESYPHVGLNAGWRVIVCRDGLQWILQARNRAETVSRTDWRGRSYCTTRDALIACCDRFCGAIDPAAAATLEALPWHIGDAVDVVRAVRAPKVIAAVTTMAAAPVRGPRPVNLMQAAFLAAAKRRAARDPNGKITLPTGVVEAGELAQVLGALDRAASGDR